VNIIKKSRFVRFPVEVVKEKLVFNILRICL